MHGLIEALLLTMLIIFILFVGALFTAGRNGHHWLNSHAEMPIEEPSSNVRVLPTETAIEDDLDRFFEVIEGYRRDFDTV